MNPTKYQGTIKRIESLLALALRKGGEGAEALAILANHNSTTNPAPIAAAVAPHFDSAAFTVPSTGKVTVRARMTITGTGGTTVATETMLFQLRMDGAVVPNIGQANAEVSATGLFAGACLVWDFSGITPGAHTFGIQATNVTTGAHTSVVPALDATVEVAAAL